jgi:hypothetical protein
VAATDNPEVLLIHGGNRELVAFFRQLFESLGISASSAMDEPSSGLAQEEKVQALIADCTLLFVILAFDDGDRASQGARPNVYDELTRCLARREATIVLQERRNAQLIELPSNVQGRVVAIEFDRSHLHDCIPPILREVTSRGMVFPRSSPQDSYTSGGILNRFLDEMDKLWDNEFDVAWNRIHQRDFKAETDVTIALDKFFQQYQTVISAVVRKEVRGNDLGLISQDALKQSRSLARDAWYVVVWAKLSRATEALKRQPAKGRSRLRPVLDQVSNALRQGQKARDPMEGISKIRQALETLEHTAGELLNA